MRILFVTLVPIDSNESSAIRNNNLVRGLVDSGHSIEVLTTYASKNSALRSDIIIKYIYPNRNYEETRTKSTKSGSLFIKLGKNIYHKLSIYDSTVKFLKDISIGLLESDYYDIVISSSDPVTSHLAVLKLKRQGLSWGKWIQYWGDPYVGDITRKSIYPEFVLRQVEEHLIKDADKIVYVSPFTLRRQKELYPEKARVFNFLPIPYSEIESSIVNNNLPFRIGYFGAYHSSVRNILPLYNACCEMEGDIQLLLVGNSDLNLSSKKNIIIRDRMQKDELKQYELECDALVCVLNLKGSQLPGKIYHYAGTRKPILVLIDGDNRDEVRNYLSSFNRFNLSDNNESAIIDALKHLMLHREVSPCLELNPRVIADKFIQ